MSTIRPRSTQRTAEGQSNHPSGTQTSHTTGYTAKGSFSRAFPAGMPCPSNISRPIHYATYEECARFAQYGLLSSFPYSCWQGSGNNQPAGGLDLQTPYGLDLAPDKVIDLMSISNSVEYVIFDGVHLDAKGITQNPLGLRAAGGGKLPQFMLKIGIPTVSRLPAMWTTLDRFPILSHVKFTLPAPYDTNMVGDNRARCFRDIIWHV